MSQGKVYPAGSISDQEGNLAFRPVVLKTFLKGLLLIAVFSLFLEINPSTYVNYLIFLALTIGSVAALSLVKRQTKFLVDDEGVQVKRLFQRKNTIMYRDILDLSVSQGMLARRFRCGTVYIILKAGRGSVKLLGGGIAERLEDIPDPNKVCDILSSRLSPFGQGVAESLT